MKGMWKKVAFDISYHGNYGNGSKGNLTAGSAQTINAYAQVTAIGDTVIEVGNISDSTAFKVGNEFLLHVAAYSGTENYCSVRGKWTVVKIKSVNGTILGVNKHLNNFLGSYPISDCYVQLVSLPDYKTVTINRNKSITCPAFSTSNKYGGVVAFKCSDELILNGGHIDVASKGLPDNTLWAKGAIKNETHGRLMRKSVGHENSRTMQHLPLNYPGGAIFIITKKLTCNSNSRIGNPNVEGEARNTYRSNTAVNEAYWGGSSIFIAAETISEFNPKIIAKYPTPAEDDNRRGKPRCLIATETEIPCDEGLYAHERISDPTRMSRTFNIKDFGDGSDGTKSNIKTQLNNYAAVSAIDKTRKVFTVADRTSDGLAKFKEGALVMVHVNLKSEYATHAGKFIFAHILGINLNQITIDTEFFPNYKSSITPANYEIQMITVPQFTSFTLSKENTGCMKYDKGRGGIIALACSDTCNLSGGVINTVGKGGGNAYGENGLKVIDNANMATRLPIGQGNGSVFILAKNLTMDTSTRIGGTQSGNDVGGLMISGEASSPYDSRGAVEQTFEAGCYMDTSTHLPRRKADGTRDVYTHWIGSWGGGDQGGKCYIRHNGGFGSNSTDGAYQGAHILIIADKITGFNLNAISTGGMGAAEFSVRATATLLNTAHPGGCGYGGSGGAVKKNGYWNSNYYGGNGGWLGGGGGCGEEGRWAGGGGSGAFCFVYCNKVAAQKTSGISLD